MAPQVKSSKQATKGAKQIVDENVSTLNFYRNMIFGAAGIYLTMMSVLFEFTTLTTLITFFFFIIHAGSYQFMSYMSKTKYTESGQLIDSGVDLNMEGGIAEHIKDLIILTSGVHVLSLLSNYFLLLWLLAPLRALWMLWVNILSPWIFAQPPAQTEMDEKKQKKLERKAKRMK